MKNYETTLSGVALLIFAAFLYYHKNEELAGVAALAGIAALRSADANKTIQKDELHELGLVGRKLGREVEAADAKGPNR